MTSRDAIARTIVFTAGQTDSQEIDLSDGCFGTFLCPAALGGLTMQVVAVNNIMGDVPLLSVAKTLTSGANAFTAEEVAEVGAVGLAKLRLGSNAPSNQTGVLLWKS